MGADLGRNGDKTDGKGGAGERILEEVLYVKHGRSVWVSLEH